MTALQTQDGLIYLEDLPRVAMSARVIGDTLSKINRFAGRTDEPWSVSAHSVLVSRLCSVNQQDAAWALLHDAHEAYIGDIIGPAVSFVASQSFPLGGRIVSNCIHSAKYRLDKQIKTAWGLDTAPINFANVARADAIALAAEMFHFFGTEPVGIPEPVFDRALSILLELPVCRDWTVAQSIWNAEVDDYTSFGFLNPPPSRESQTA